MEAFESPCGSHEPGLVTLVQRALENNTPVMTLEEIQRVGALDPVAYEIDTDTEHDKPVVYSLDKATDGPKIAEIVKSFKVLDVFKSSVCLCVFCVHTYLHRYTHIIG